MSEKPLLDWAGASGLTPRASWGTAMVIQDRDVDLSGIRQLVESSGCLATARLGPDLTPLQLDGALPSGPELEELRRLADGEPLLRSLDTAGSRWAVASALADHLEEVEVRYDEPNWCLSVEVLTEAVSAHWLAVADAMRDGPVRVAGLVIPMGRLDASPAAIRVPEVLETDGKDAQEASDALSRLADAMAWRDLAIDEERIDGGLRVALHRDQLAEIGLSPSSANGGLHVWRWRHATDDANREEALRHVLRLVTANVRTIPDGAAVVALAERHRIALSHENAVEVERAIVEGRTRTTDALELASGSLAGFADDSTRAAQASLVASLGIVAFVAQQGTALPGWLILVVVAVAVAGAAALAATRLSRVRQLEATVSDMVEDLGPERDPLLPQAERERLEQRIEAFGLHKQTRSSRWHIVAFAALSSVVMIIAGWWVTTREREAPLSAPLVAADGHVRFASGKVELCERLIGADPPDCVGSQLDVLGLDSSSVPQLVGSADVQWSEQPIQLSGVIEDGVLTVVTTPIQP